MTDIVTGSHPQTIISGREGDYGSRSNYGDSTLNSFLLQQRMGSDHADLVRDIVRETGAVALAVEKTAAAAQLTVEKTAAAAALLAAQNAAAQLAATERCCCEVKELVRELDANRIRDDLNRVNAELLAIRYASPSAPRP